VSIVSVDTIQNVAGTKSVPSADLVDGRCTAWVNFNGVTGAILASFNVGSITRLATGQYHLNFTTQMVNTNYVGCGTAGKAGGAPSSTNGGVVILNEAVASNYLGYLWFQVVNLSGSFSDYDNVQVAIFGGK